MLWRKRKGTKKDQKQWSSRIRQCVRQLTQERFHVLRIGLIVDRLSKCHHHPCALSAKKVALLMTTFIPAGFNKPNSRKDRQTHNSGRQTDKQKEWQQHS